MMGDAQQFYDSFAAEYNYFVNWSERLSFELPFLEQILHSANATSIIDLAGGTGQHALALVQAGFQVTLADISAAMIQQASDTAAQRQLELPVIQAGFGELRHYVEPVDALLCLGNSLPHVLDTASLHSAVADMAAVIKPGGVMIWQLRNFAKVLAAQERFIAPQSGGTMQDEWLFVRFYDFIPPHIRFNMLKLHRQVGERWQQHLEQTLLYPWVQSELVPALMAEGWGTPQVYGSLKGEPFEVDSSGDLILVTRRIA